MKAKKCGYCGSINTSEAKRCLRCGTNIVSAIVSDDYEREDVLTFGNEVVSISSTQSAPPVEQPQYVANPLAASRATLERTAVQTAASDRGESLDEEERETPARKERAKRSLSPQSTPNFEPVPRRAPKLLVNGARLLGWLLLAGSLAAAAFTVKRFGFSPDADASLAALLELKRWDPYWAALAAGVALLGLVVFVLLQLGASIVENLAVIRAELYARSEHEQQARSSDTADPAAKQEPASSEPIEKRATNNVTMPEEETGTNQEPAFSLSADQFLEHEQDVYGKLEPLVANDDKDDRRKEPTLGA